MRGLRTATLATSFGQLDLFLVLCEGELSEFFLSLDEVDAHVALEHLLKTLVENGKIFHNKGFGEELLGWLSLRKLHEHLELLFLCEVLNRNFWQQGFLSGVIGS